jgi:hypothetical protein
VVDYEVEIWDGAGKLVYVFHGLYSASIDEDIDSKLVFG